MAQSPPQAFAYGWPRVNSSRFNRVQAAHELAQLRDGRRSSESARGSAMESSAGASEAVSHGSDRLPFHFVDDLVDDAILERLDGRHEVVAIGVSFDLFQRLAGVLN